MNIIGIYFYNGSMGALGGRAQVRFWLTDACRERSAMRVTRAGAELRTDSNTPRTNLSRFVHINVKLDARRRVGVFTRNHLPEYVVNYPISKPKNLLS